MAWGACRRGVRAHRAPGGHDHGSHGGEATVDSALSLLLEAGQPFDYAQVRDLVEPKVPEAPLLTLSGQPDLKIYDGLLTSSMAVAAVCG